MATKTISRLYDKHEDALAAVRDLEAAGFLPSDIGIAAGNVDDRYNAKPVVDEHEAASGAGVGATVGALAGGGAGLAAALGALAIPGFGPVVAAGVLAATLTGAGAGGAAGGLIGSLTGLGVSDREAHVYAEGMRRGGSLVTVKIDDTRELEARGILDRYTHVDLAAREADYRASGWTGYGDVTDRPIGR